MQSLYTMSVTTYVPCRVPFDSPSLSLPARGDQRPRLASALVHLSCKLFRFSRPALALRLSTQPYIKQSGYHVLVDGGPLL